MIPKSHKFPMRTEFVSLRQKAKKIITSQVVIYYRPARAGQQSGALARLSVVIPKKVNKLATVRNWLKRLTYDALWPIIKDNTIDMVVIYKPLALKKSLTTKQQLVHELTQTTTNL